MQKKLVSLIKEPNRPPAQKTEKVKEDPREGEAVAGLAVASCQGEQQRHGNMYERQKCLR